jgi:hypothetical protein
MTFETLLQLLRTCCNATELMTHNGAVVAAAAGA